MANVTYIIGGKVHEDTEAGVSVIVGGKVLQEATAAAGGGLSIPIAMYHYMHHLRNVFLIVSTMLLI